MRNPCRRCFLHGSGRAGWWKTLFTMFPKGPVAKKNCPIALMIFVRRTHWISATGSTKRLSLGPEDCIFGQSWYETRGLAVWVISLDVCSPTVVCKCLQLKKQQTVGKQTHSSDLLIQFYYRWKHLAIRWQLQRKRVLWCCMQNVVSFFLNWSHEICHSLRRTLGQLHWRLAHYQNTCNTQNRTNDMVSCCALALVRGSDVQYACNKQPKFSTSTFGSCNAGILLSKLRSSVPKPLFLQQLVSLQSTGPATTLYIPNLPAQRGNLYTRNKFGTIICNVHEMFCVQSTGQMRNRCVKRIFCP